MKVLTSSENRVAKVGDAFSYPLAQQQGESHIYR